MKIGLYCTSLSGDDPATRAFIEELKSSGFNTVVIWTLFVQVDTTIMWNGQPLVYNGQFMVPWLARAIELLKAPPSTVETVLLSIGAGGSENAPNLTWKRINDFLQDPILGRELTRNFQVLAESLPVDGFDFDDEDYYEATAIERVAEIFAALNDRMIITFCPYTMEKFWADRLPPLYTWSQNQVPPRDQPVKWMNLQCYAGNTNTQAPAVIETFVSAITGEPAGSTGIPYGNYASYAREFIVPGLAVSVTYYDYSGQKKDRIYSPANIQASFTQLSGVGGGWLWNSASIPGEYGYTLKDYARAIIDGLNAAGQVVRERREQSRVPSPPPTA